MKNNVSVIIPVFNEEKVISDTIKDIRSAMPKGIKYEIICVNDGSTDNSKKALCGIKGIRVINHEQNKGYGASLKSGIKASRYDWILITDADGTYPVKDIPKLMKETGYYDMVIGSRDGANVNIPFFRRPAKAVLNRFASFLAKKTSLT